MTKKSSVTSFDVARRAGVSRAAVSRCFTPGSSISAATRQKVLAAAQQIGYRVNPLARALQSNRTKFVAVLASRMDNPIRAKQIHQLSTALLRNDFLPVLLVSDEFDDFEEKITEIMQYKVCGIIVTSDTPPAALARHCALQGTPLVAVNKDQAAIPFDRVLCGSDKVGQAVIDIFQRAGVREVVAMRTENRSFTVHQRVDSALQAAEKIGLSASELSVPDMSYANGQLGADLLVRKAPKLGNCGVFCAADYLALGFIDQIRYKHRLLIPGDIQVIGFDNIPESARAPYNLTTFHHNTLEVAEQCVELLKRRIKDPDAPAVTRDVFSRPIIRSSTAQHSSVASTHQL